VKVELSSKNGSRDQRILRLKDIQASPHLKYQKLKEWTEGHFPIDDQIETRKHPFQIIPSITLGLQIRSSSSQRKSQTKIPSQELIHTLPTKLHLRDSNSRATRALVALSSHDHVIESTKIKTGGSPGVNVRAKVDGAAGAVVGADRPVLLEGRGALDRGLVLARGLEKGVGGAVDVGAADGAGGRRRVVAAEGLDDVELDEGRFGPAVEGEIPVAGGLDVGVVGDGPEGGLLVFVFLVFFLGSLSRNLLGGGRVPANTGDDVARGLGPVERVRAAADLHGGAGVVLDPVRVVVVTLLAGARGGVGRAFNGGDGGAGTSAGIDRGRVGGGGGTSRVSGAGISGGTR
jgi:hypothetical protein